MKFCTENLFINVLYRNFIRKYFKVENQNIVLGIEVYYLKH